MFQSRFVDWQVHFKPTVIPFLEVSPHPPRNMSASDFIRLDNLVYLLEAKCQRNECVANWADNHWSIWLKGDEHFFCKDVLFVLAPGWCYWAACNSVLASNICECVCVSVRFGSSSTPKEQFPWSNMGTQLTPFLSTLPSLHPLCVFNLQYRWNEWVVFVLCVCVCVCVCAVLYHCSE